MNSPPEHGFRHRHPVSMGSFVRGWINFEFTVYRGGKTLPAAAEADGVAWQAR